MIHCFVHDWSGNFAFQGRTDASSFSLFFSRVVAYFQRALTQHPSDEKHQILLTIGSRISKEVTTHFTGAGPAASFLLEYSSSKWRNNASQKMGEAFGRMIDLYVTMPEIAPIAGGAGLDSLQKRIIPAATRFENDEITSWGQDDATIKAKYPSPDLSAPPKDGTTIPRWSLSVRGRTAVAHGYCSFMRTGKNVISQPVYVFRCRRSNFFVRPSESDSEQNYV
jgi:hypothetical protein